MSTEQKIQRYEELLPQLAALLEGETDEVSVLANAAALLHTTMGWFWTGFYMVRLSDGSPLPPVSEPAAEAVGKELRLGPFQGPPACMHIGYGRGVCGTAWKERRTIVVPDVEQFPGHIACSSLSRSEIVVPLFADGERIVGVLDIDSRELSTFDDVDRRYLEQAMAVVAKVLY